MYTAPPADARRTATIYKMKIQYPDLEALLLFY